MVVHGGSWQRGRAGDYSFLAEAFVKAGAHMVIPDFAWVQSLTAMADQVRRALAWTAKNAASFGGAADKIFLTWHLSGGHLAVVALTADWGAFGLTSSPIHAALCVSGIYDLRGTRLSSRREYVHIDDVAEEL